MGVKEPICGENEVECLAVSGCNGAAPLLEGQSLAVKYVQRKLGQVIQQSVTWLEAQFMQWTQPTKTSQIASTLTDLKRPRMEFLPPTGQFMSTPQSTTLPISAPLQPVSPVDVEIDGRHTSQIRRAAVT